MRHVLRAGASAIVATILVVSSVGAQISPEQVAGMEAEDFDKLCLSVGAELAAQHDISAEEMAAMQAFCLGVAKQDGERGMECFAWTVWQGVLLARQNGMVLDERMAGSLYGGCVGR